MSESSSKLSLCQVSSTNQRATGNCSDAISAQAEIDFEPHNVTQGSCLAMGLVGRDRTENPQRRFLASIVAAKQLLLFTSAHPQHPVLTKEYDQDVSCLDSFLISPDQKWKLK